MTNPLYPFPYKTFFDIETHEFLKNLKWGKRSEFIRQAVKEKINKCEINKLGKQDD